MLKVIFVSIFLLFSYLQAENMSVFEAAKIIAYTKQIRKGLEKIDKTHKKIEKSILTNMSAKDKKGYYQINLTDGYVLYNVNSFLSKNFDKDYLNLIASSTALSPLAFDLYKEKDKVFFKLPLSAEVMDFLKKADELKASNFVQTTTPTFDPNNPNKLWYKPNGVGGFYVYKYGKGKWELLEKKALDSLVGKSSLVIVKNKEELQKLIAKKGDVAYVNSDDHSIQKYIYDGQEWILKNTSFTYRQVVECSEDEVGVVKYIPQKDCLSSCQKNDNNTYTWECIYIKVSKEEDHNIKNSSNNNPSSNFSACQEILNAIKDDPNANIQQVKNFCKKTDDGKSVWKSCLLKQADQRKNSCSGISSKEWFIYDHAGGRGFYAFNSNDMKFPTSGRIAYHTAFKQVLPYESPILNGDFCLSKQTYKNGQSGNGIFSFAKKGYGYSKYFSGCVVSLDKNQYFGGHSSGVGEKLWNGKSWQNASEFKKISIFYKKEN